MYIHIYTYIFIYVIYIYIYMYRLHYYLADNTMEVLPIQGPSEGRDKVPKYLKKSHIMMKPTADDIQMTKSLSEN
jgi:hypothetical protein